LNVNAAIATGAVHFSSVGVAHQIVHRSLVFLCISLAVSQADLAFRLCIQKFRSLRNTVHRGGVLMANAGRLPGILGVLEAKSASFRA
jgi:hypothetical protein